MELVEQLKNILASSLKTAIENKISADALIESIEDRFTDELEVQPTAQRIGTRKIELGKISKEAYEYFQSIKQNEFKTDLHWNDYYNTDMIFETIDGYLVVSDKYWGLGSEWADGAYLVSWYPRGYEYFEEQKSKKHWEDGESNFIIVETEEFKTPKFLLKPEQIPKYCVQMGRKGFMMMSEFEYRDFGWKYDDDSHDDDFVKEV